MKIKNLFILFILVSITVYSVAKQARKEQKPVIGVVIKVSNDVQMLPEGKLRWSKVKAGQFIYKGNKLRTGSKSRVAVNFVNGIEMKIDINTTISVLPIDEMLNETKIKLISGQIRTKVSSPKESKFKVIAGVATISTNEADFDAESYIRLTVKVYKGEVEIGNELGKKIVKKGKRNTTIALSPPGEIERIIQKNIWQDEIMLPEERRLFITVRTEEKKKKKFELKFKKIH